MRRLLGSLLVVVASTALHACGDDTGDDRADDPASQSPTSPADGTDPVDPTDRTDPADPPGPEVIAIVSGSAAGGEVVEQATLIEDDQALQRYLRQLDSPSLVADVTAAVEAHPPAPDRVVGLAVIEISCDEPSSAQVREEDGRFLLSAGKVVSPHQECYVPVTSVAVLDLPRP